MKCCQEVCNKCKKARINKIMRKDHLPCCAFYLFLFVIINPAMLSTNTTAVQIYNIISSFSEYTKIAVGPSLEPMTANG